MATDQITGAGLSAAAPNGAGNSVPDFTVKSGLAQMLKGGVIMDVVDAEQVCPSSCLKRMSGRRKECQRRGAIANDF